MKKVLLGLVALSLICSTSLVMAEGLHIAHASKVIVGHQKAEPNTGVDVCNTLGPSTNEYNLDGYFVAGPANTLLDESQFIGAPCTPKSTVTLTKVEAGWQYYGYGANEIQVCLYNDSGSNSPGTQIGKCVNIKNLPTFGTTNTLVTANFTKQALSLTGGTQYWIVGQTPAKGTGDDAVDVWDGQVQETSGNVAGGGWSTFEADPSPAMKVSGQ